MRAAAIDALAARTSKRRVPTVRRARAQAARSTISARRAQVALGKIATPPALAALIALTRTPPVSTRPRPRCAAPARRRSRRWCASSTGARPAARRSPPPCWATSAIGAPPRRSAARSSVGAIWRPSALEALARLADPAAVPTLVRAAESGDLETRRRAFAALLALGDARALVTLPRGLADRDANVRELAARLAGAIARAQSSAPRSRRCWPTASGTSGARPPTRWHRGRRRRRRRCSTNVVAGLRAAGRSGRATTTNGRPSASVRTGWPSRATPRASPPRGRRPAGRSGPRWCAPFAAGHAGARRSPPRASALQLIDSLGGERPLAIAAAEALAVGTDPGRRAARVREAFRRRRPPTSARAFAPRSRRCRERRRLAGGAGPRPRRAAEFAPPPPGPRAGTTTPSERDRPRPRRRTTRARGRQRARGAGRGPAAIPPESWVGARLAATRRHARRGRWVTVSAAGGGEVWAKTDDAGGVRLSGRLRPGGCAFRCPPRARSDRAPILAPVLQARDHRGDRLRQVAGRDAVAEVDGQLLARQRRGRRHAIWAASSASPPLRQQRADDAAEHVAAARRRQRGARDRADVRAPVGRRDHRARPLEHDDRARRGRQPARVPQPIGLDVRRDSPDEPAHLARVRRQHARRGRGREHRRRVGPQRVQRVGVEHHRPRRRRRQPPHDRRACHRPVGMPGPIAIACARAASLASAATLPRRVDLGALRVARRSSTRRPWRRARPAPAPVDASVTRPAPERSAACPTSTAAPVFPGEPATTSRCPALPLCADGAPPRQHRRDARLVQQVRSRAARAGATSGHQDRHAELDDLDAARRARRRPRTGPACARPSSRSRRRGTPTPSARPVSASRPDGMSTASLRARRGVHRRDRRAPARRSTAPRTPMPKMASTMTAAPANQLRQGASVVQPLPSSIATPPMRSQRRSFSAASPRDLSRGAAISTRAPRRPPAPGGARPRSRRRRCRPRRRRSRRRPSRRPVAAASSSRRDDAGDAATRVLHQEQARDAERR